MFFLFEEEGNTRSYSTPYQHTIKNYNNGFSTSTFVFGVHDVSLFENNQGFGRLVRLQNAPINSLTHE